jgi:hypothetical protein
MIGTPEWGEQHEAYPQRDASNWGSASYRWIGGSQLGNALAIRLTTGGIPAWNRTVFFEYLDRYWEIEKQSPTWSGTNGISSFVHQMWTAYRNGGGIITEPPAVVTFAIGDRIETLNVTNVRASGTLAGTLLGTQAQGALGSITGGSVIADNITWWQVNYDNGADGWSGEDNFKKPLNQTARPPAPFGLKVGK